MTDATRAIGSERAGELANRFERINDELLAVVEPLDETQWFACCEGEQATIAAVVSHVGGSYRAISGWIRAVATGDSVPVITREMIDEGNARHAARHARRPKDEALAALRANAVGASEMVRGLSDEELDRAAFLTQFNRTLSAYQLVDEILIGHPLGHLASIRETIAASR
jgi:uncharacterized damage-inducible protein DinB